AWLGASSPAFAHDPSRLNTELPKMFVSGDAATALIRSGDGAQLANAYVWGTIWLQPGTVVTGPFICTHCVIHGSIQASGVTFDGPVDLTGTRITGDFDAIGALFKDVLVLSSDSTGASSVRELTRLDGAVLARGATFDHTRFGGVFNLSAATVSGFA